MQLLGADDKIGDERRERGRAARAPDRDRRRATHRVRPPPAGARAPRRRPTARPRARGAARGREPAPAPRPPCRVLELAGHLVVVAERGRRPVPRAAIRVLLAVEHVRKRPVDGLPLRERGIAVERRADERMAELDAPSNARTRPADSAARVRSGSMPTSRPPRRPSRGCRCRRPRRAGAAAAPAPAAGARARDRPLDLRALGQRIRQRRATGELLRAQKVRELDQREWIPAGAFDQPVAHLGRKRRRTARRAAPRPPRRRALEPQLGQPSPSNRRTSPSRAAKSITTPSASSRRAANVSASADGRSSHCASSTTHSERLLLGGLREKTQYRHADQEAVLDGIPRQTQRPRERGRLRLREAHDAVKDRADKLVQRGERELALGLDPARAQHPHPRCLVDRVPEQRRLADAGSPRITSAPLREDPARAIRPSKAADSASLPKSTCRSYRPFRTG